MKTLTNCRFCGSSDLEKYLDLGMQPLANNLCDSFEEAILAKRFPLQVNFCKNCTMSQLGVVVPPEILFANYLYRSGMSQQFKWHCQELVCELSESEALCSDDVVVDIASNDGTLLYNYSSCVKRIGVEPATNLCKIAEEKGIKCINKFWDMEVAKEILSLYGKATVVTAQNVFAHVDDVSSFILAVKEVLSEYGTFVIEAPWVGDYINNGDFSSTYHEHLSYISVKGMCKFIEQFGMSVHKIKYFNNLHTGSIRYYIRNNKSWNSPVSNKWEIENAIYRESFINEKIIGFQAKTDIIKKNLFDILEKNVIMCGKEGNRSNIVGLGQAAKATVMCNYFALNTYIDTILDSTPEKIGKYQPGTGIKIESWDKLKHWQSKLNYLIFPYNWEKEVIKNAMKDSRAHRFISWMPEVKEIVM